MGLVATFLGLAGAAHAQAELPSHSPVLMAAGSLRQAMDEILTAYQAQGGAQFVTQYGPSGKLRKEIEAGRTVDVFASASLEHVDALSGLKRLGPSHVFAHNDLCVVAQPEIHLRETNLLEVLSRPTVRLATSTPVTDPMGDYTWEFFRNADRRQPGIYQILDAKALKLSGATAPEPGSKPPYISAFEQNKTDVYVMYCTNAVLTKNALPRLTVVRIPEALNVRSAYGIAARPASVEGERLIHFVLRPAGQQILKKYGFH